MRYRSEVEAMQWDDARLSMKLQDIAAEIVAWINANGGEARYEPHVTSNPYDDQDPGAPRIAVRTVNGWAYAAPGHYVVMGEMWFPRPEEFGMSAGATTCHEFYPCDPETFRQVAAAYAAHLMA